MQAPASALDKELPALETGALGYMVSEQQCLSDQSKRWHPHLIFIPGDAVESWGGDLAGSPVIAASGPEEQAVIFMVWIGR